jgi:CBS domain-containing membrane protein
MKVREIMTVEAATIERCDSVELAEKRMEEHRIRHLPVVDGDVLVGIVSQRDVLAASLPRITHPDPEDDRDLKRRTRVEKIMRGLVETVTSETDVIEAARALLTYRIGCLPVVDERLHIMGIVTEADFVRLVHDVLLRRRAADERRRAGGDEG